MHPVRRQGRTDTELLYCYRTPPYVKVGRPPLDDEARALLERQYPDIKFDWERILREPPQALNEQEALRRKEHRDARDARRKRRRSAEASGLESTEPMSAEPVTERPLPSGRIPDDEEEEEDLGEAADVLTSDRSADATGEAPPQESEAARSRRRRRRRRRGKRPGEPGGNTPGTPPNGSV